MRIHRRTLRPHPSAASMVKSTQTNSLYRAKGASIMELMGTFRRHPLDAIFAPRNVAVIGATEKEDSVGRTLLWNLISNPFGGTVFPVNPKRNNVMGIRSYP